MIVATEKISQDGSFVLWFAIMRQDKRKFYYITDYAYQAMHFAGIGGILFGLSFWVSPLVITGCAAFSAVLAAGGGKLAHNLIGKHFIRHDISTENKAGLAKAVSEFTKKAGLKSAPTLHDFKLDTNNICDGEMEMMPQLRRVFNASANGLNTNQLIVSQPLLNALHDPEIHSVIGHEFAHLGAGHTKTKLAGGWLQTTTMLTGTFVLGSAIFSAGWVAGTLAIAGMFGVVYAGRKAMPDQNKRYTRDGTPRPEVQREEIGILAAQESIMVGVMALPNPVAILSACAVEQTSFWGAMLLNRSLSRRHEFQADRGAVEMGADPLALIQSLRRIERSLELNEPELASSKNWRQGPWYMRTIKMASSVTKSHPDTVRRCKRLAKMAEKQGVDNKRIKATLYNPIDETGLYLDSSNDKPSGSSDDSRAQPADSFNCESAQDKNALSSDIMNTASSEFQSAGNYNKRDADCGRRTPQPQKPPKHNLYSPLNK